MLRELFICEIFKTSNQIRLGYMGRVLRQVDVATGERPVQYIGEHVGTVDVSTEAAW